MSTESRIQGRKDLEALVNMMEGDADYRDGVARGCLTFAEHLIPKGETLLTMTPEQVRQFETETITFGKHAGQRYGDVPREYLEWLADQAVRLQSYLRAT